MSDVKININGETILAAISIAMGLVKSGTEIYEMIKNKDELTEADLLAIIDRENVEQAEAKEKLRALLEAPEEE